ncbi:MAG: uroporphyrinogen decarboxylase family protein [Bacteroidales bacterium]
MNGLEKTKAALAGNKAGNPPFHPIIMRWAANYNKVKYSDFCLVPEVKCNAMIKCAEDFGIDWVTVMSDPWAEASAFGIEVSYPDYSLPVDAGGHLSSAIEAARLKQYDPLQNRRCRGRLEELRIFRERVGNELFIVGWVEGPVAEYVDIRKASEAAVDLCTDPEAVSDTMDIIVESAINFITLQVEAGAHCIGIGDAFCSQIGPELYNYFGFERQKRLVSHIHSLGAIAKLHICGDTTSILPQMIKTGADIIDIDHLVKEVAPFVHIAGTNQVFSGKSDPVTVICNGDESLISGSVLNDYRDSGNKYIVSAGCEITPETSAANMLVFSEAARKLLPRSS